MASAPLGAASPRRRPRPGPVADRGFLVFGDSHPSGWTAHRNRPVDPGPGLVVSGVGGGGSA